MLYNRFRLKFLPHREFQKMALDINSQKDKALKAAQDAKKKTVAAKQKITAYAKSGKKQLAIVIAVCALLVFFIFGASYQAVHNDEYVVDYNCKPTPQDDCKKYFNILKLWRPYRMTPYQVPDDNE